MKNRLIIWQVLIAILVIFLTACDKTPQVFSLNNFTAEFSSGSSVATVAQLPVKEIDGTWSGMGHYIKITPGSINNTDIYTAEMIDTDTNSQSIIDTTSYSVLFVTVAGHPFAEVISKGRHTDEHDFMLPVSTYLKINKFSADTIIVQMPSGAFTAAYMKSNNYHYFIPAEFKNEKEFPVYITEDPDRLADLLNSLCNFTAAFQAQDTLIRMH